MSRRQTHLRPTEAATVLVLVLGLAASAIAGCDASPPDESSHRIPAGSEDRPNPDATRPNPSGPTPKGHVSRGWRVDRVIDGDTISVRRGGQAFTVRLIGIDTPETVHPTEPIECFGRQASRFAQRRLWGRTVTLEFDRSQGRRDYYGRTLAYVWDEARRSPLFNYLAVRKGYALEYTYDRPYRWRAQFRRAEGRAQSKRLGIWACPRPGS